MNNIISYIESAYTTIVPFVVLLGLLIFVHEMGHFLVAKFWKVRVETFSLGFGKKIFSFKRGDTTYCVSLFPLGGYVKMYGDDPTAEITEENKKFSYSHKPVFQRITIVLAGPLMNFFFAIGLFAIVATMGEQVRSPILGDVLSQTEAYNSGFRSGDKILSIEGTKMNTWEEVLKALTLNAQKQTTFLVERPGSPTPEKIIAKPTLGVNKNLLTTEDTVGEIEGFSNISKAPIVGVKEGSIAFLAGLKTGDLIQEINGEKVSFFRDLETKFQTLQGQVVAIKIDRINPEANEKPSKIEINLTLDNSPSLASIGIEKGEVYIAKVIADTPAEKAGLKAGDRVLAINDQPINQWEDIPKSVMNFDEKIPLTFEVQSGSEVKKVPITPKLTVQKNLQGLEDKRFTIGISPWTLQAQPETSTLVTSNPFGAIARGYQHTMDVTKMTLVSFLRILQAKISPKSLGGVISIGQAATETYKMGLSHFIQMMAILSVNLFILNLLPVPVLDGGHLVFYTIEAIKGTPLSMRKLEIAQQVGLFLLMSLMVFALFNDFSRLLGNS